MEAKTILIVDNEPAYVVPYRHALEDRGFEVMDVRGPQECMEQLGIRSFDAVIIDIMMPHGPELDHVETRGYAETGYVLARWVKKRYPSAAVVGLTEWVERPEVANWFREQGADLWSKVSLRSPALFVQHVASILGASDGRRRNRRIRSFIGSSREGLPIANKIQELLSDSLSVVVWNQGTVFGLGDATLESLEAAVLDYHCGVFIFTPDDEVNKRGQRKSVARDNVLFELGLFVGKVGRRNAFVVHPSGNVISLPTDLLGISCATYDQAETDLVAALGPVCNRIRKALGLR